MRSRSITVLYQRPAWHQLFSRRRTASSRAVDTSTLDNVSDTANESASPSKCCERDSHLTDLIKRQATLQNDLARRTASLEARATRLKTSVEPIESATSSVSASHHHDLQSFLEFANKTSLTTTTTVYRGTLFEYTVADAVRRYGMSLERVGKTNDRGIDLRGHWTLPSTLKVPVFVQCKLSKPLPQVVRELEGTYSGAPATWRGGNTIALLASQHAASAGVVQALQRSSSPLGFMQVTAAGYVKQFLWNSHAADNGLAGVGVTTRHQPDSPGVANSSQTGLEMESAIALTWLGRPWLSSA